MSYHRPLGYSHSHSVVSSAPSFMKSNLTRKSHQECLSFCIRSRYYHTWSLLWFNSSFVFLGASYHRKSRYSKGISSRATKAYLTHVFLDSKLRLYVPRNWNFLSYLQTTYVQMHNMECEVTLLISERSMS